jgi:hypothetical protein
MHHDIPELECMIYLFIPISACLTGWQAERFPVPDRTFFPGMFVF